MSYALSYDINWVTAVQVTYTNKLTLLSSSAKEMELGSFVGGQDGEHISVGFMEISIIIFSAAGWSSL